MYKNPFLKYPEDEEQEEVSQLRGIAGLPESEPSPLDESELPDFVPDQEPPMDFIEDEEGQPTPQRDISGLLSDYDQFRELQKLDNNRQLMTDLDNSFRTMNKALASRGGAKIDVEQKKDPTNLLDQYLKLQRNQAVSRMKTDLYYVQNENGDFEPRALALNDRTGKYYDPDTGEEVSASSVKSRVYKPDQRTTSEGDIIQTDPLGRTKEIYSSKRKTIDDMSKEDKTQFVPTKGQRSDIDRIQKDYQTLTTDMRKVFYAADRIEEALKNGDAKLLASFVRTQMPRLAGEVGNLNETEQKAWQGAQDIRSRMEQFVTTQVKGTLTPANIKELNKMVKIFKDNSRKAFEGVTESVYRRAEKVYGIPREFTQEAIVNYLPTKQTKPTQGSKPTTMSKEKLQRMKDWLADPKNLQDPTYEAVKAKAEKQGLL
jgi:hypothetical protein